MSASLLDRFAAKLAGCNPERAASDPTLLIDAACPACGASMTAREVDWNDGKPAIRPLCGEGCDERKVLDAIGWRLPGRPPPESPPRRKRTRQHAPVVDPGAAAGDWRPTDASNAELFAEQHADRLRYAPGLGWLAWDGRRWQRDADGEALRSARQTAHGLRLDAAIAGSDAQERWEWAMKSEQAPRLDAMVRVARVDLRLVVKPEMLDADPWLLNCQNGTVDLHTGELREHRREDLLTKIAGAAFRPDAPAATFELFIERVLPDRDVRGYMQRLAGCASVGKVVEHVLPFLYGTGANGKTTLSDALRSALGEFAIQAPPDLLVAKREMSAGDHSAVARLAGVRLATTIEVDDGKQLAEVLVKQLTGEHTLSAKLMRQDHFEFTNAVTIVLVANHKPQVRGTDHAIWRRVQLVPFEVTIPEAEQDLDLPAKLAAESEGVLAWIVRGCLEWQQRGLAPPERVVVATSGYRDEQDPLADWLDACCVLGAQGWTAGRELRAGYERFCEDEHARPVANRRFGEGLRSRSCLPEQEPGGERRKGWRGVRLRDGSELPNPVEPQKPLMPYARESEAYRETAVPLGSLGSEPPVESPAGNGHPDGSSEPEDWRSLIDNRDSGELVPRSDTGSEMPF